MWRSEKCIGGLHNRWPRTVFIGHCSISSAFTRAPALFTSFVVTITEKTQSERKRKTKCGIGMNEWKSDKTKGKKISSTQYQEHKLHMHNNLVIRLTGTLTFTLKTKECQSLSGFYHTKYCPIKSFIKNVLSPWDIIFGELNIFV